MKVVLRKAADWREISWNPELKDLFTAGYGGSYVGHSIPEFVWIEILRAAGVAVEVYADDDYHDDDMDILNFENEGGQQ